MGILFLLVGSVRCFGLGSRALVFRAGIRRGVYSSPHSTRNLHERFLYSLQSTSKLLSF